MPYQPWSSGILKRGRDWYPADFHWLNTWLAGGFKHLLFSPRNLGKMNPFWSICFRWVGSKPPASLGLVDLLAKWRWHLFVNQFPIFPPRSDVGEWLKLLTKWFTQRTVDETNLGLSKIVEIGQLIPSPEFSNMTIAGKSTMKDESMYFPIEHGAVFTANHVSCQGCILWYKLLGNYEDSEESTD